MFGLRQAICTPLLLMTTSVAAQSRELAFDRPESWAMAHASVSTLFHGVPSRPHQSGAVTLSAELASIPHISRSDTQVGFNGSKFEDLNKSPVFGRGRLLLGLPWGFGFELAYTPPVEIAGARADGVYAAALERHLWRRDQWQLNGRLFGQSAHVEADITCSESAVDAGLNDPINNPDGCVERSRDDAELDYHGAEVSLSYQLAEATQMWVGFAVTRLEPEVQVQAELIGGPDRSLLSTRGLVRTSSIGASHSIRNWRLSGTANYTPLTVRRPPTRAAQDDNSLNIRVLLSYQLR